MKKQISHEAYALADKAYAVLLGNDFNMALKDLAPLMDAEFPDISYEAVASKAKACKELIAECDALIDAGASHDDRMLLGIIKYKAELPVANEEFFWNRFDYEPFFNPVTLYLPQVPTIPNNTPEHAALKVRLFEGCAKLVGDMYAKAAAQMERGIMMPKAMVKIAVEAFGVYIYENPEDCPYTIGESNTFDITPYRTQVHQAVTSLSDNARKLVTLLQGPYYEKAPSEVGLWQYPNGKEYYQSCIREHTSLNICGEDIFRLAANLLEKMEERMAEIRQQEGYHCTHEEFTRQIMEDPKWVMNTPEEFGERLNSCVKKILPLMDDHFGVHINTPCAAVRVSPELEPYYANGIYTPASPVRKIPQGNYHYNGINVQKKNPLKTEALSYHELIPGHHYQFSVVQELEDLHPFCKAFMVTAYNEGWAEYAAAYVGEMGLYSSPLSEYGRLEQDIYITNFLVIDSGLNAMAIPLEEMKKKLAPYLPDYPGPALERQIIRIAEALPGFSLAYKLGSVKMQEYRKYAQDRLGDRFDVKEFHKTMVEWGAVPLDLLKEHIDYYIEQTLEA